MLASANQDPYFVSRLIEKNANVNATNHDGFTALMIASAKGNLAIMKILVNNGANIFATTTTAGITALRMARMANQSEAFNYLYTLGLHY